MKSNFPHFPAITQFLGSAQRKRTQTNTAQDFWSSKRRECRNAQRGMPTCALEIWKCSLSIHLWNTQSETPPSWRKTHWRSRTISSWTAAGKFMTLEPEWLNLTVSFQSIKEHPESYTWDSFGCQLNTSQYIWLKNCLYQTVGSLWDTFLIPLCVLSFLGR